MAARSQPESNENPTTVYEKREDYSFLFSPEPYQKALGMNFFQFTIAKQTPLKKHKKHQNIRGGLYYCSCNITYITYILHVSYMYYTYMTHPLNFCYTHDA